MDALLFDSLHVDVVQYCINREGGYSRRVFLDATFSGAFMIVAQVGENTEKAAVSVTVERVYKYVKFY